MQDKIKTLLQEGHILKAIAFTSEAIAAEHKLIKAQEWSRQVLIIKHQCKACSRFIDVN